MAGSIWTHITLHANGNRRKNKDEFVFTPLSKKAPKSSIIARTYFFLLNDWFLPENSFQSRRIKLQTGRSRKKQWSSWTHIWRRVIVIQFKLFKRAGAYIMAGFKHINICSRQLKKDIESTKTMLVEQKIMIWKVPPVNPDLDGDEWKCFNRTARWNRLSKFFG